MAAKATESLTQVGWDINTYDNGSDMLSYPTDRTLADRRAIKWPAGFDICPKCGILLRHDHTNPDMAFKKRPRPLDYSVTYDNQPIVSRRFREFLEAEGVTGLEFNPLNKAPDHFHLVVRNIVHLDLAHIPSFAQGPVCSHCGQPEWSIPGSRPLVLREAPRHGLSRTDLEFYDKNKRAPLRVMSLELGNKVKALKFRHCELEPVYLSPDSGT